MALNKIAGVIPNKNLVLPDESDTAFIEHIFSKKKNKYSNLSYIGKGANGTAYKAYDKELGKYVILKLMDFRSRCFVHGVDSSRGYEVSKNAQDDLRNILAPIIEHGHISYMFIRFDYSTVMYLDGYQTVKEYVKAKNKCISAYSNDQSKSDEIYRHKIASIAIAIEFLEKTISLHENGVFHGDLNPGNVMLHFNPGGSVDSPAASGITADDRTISVMLIDAGTSKKEDTSAQVEINREVRLSWETTKKLINGCLPIGFTRDLFFLDFSKDVNDDELKCIEYNQANQFIMNLHNFLVFMLNFCRHAYRNEDLLADDFILLNECLDNSFEYVNWELVWDRIAKSSISSYSGHYKLVIYPELELRRI